MIHIAYFLDFSKPFNFQPSNIKLSPKMALLTLLLRFVLLSLTLSSITGNSQEFGDKIRDDDDRSNKVIPETYRETSCPSVAGRHRFHSEMVQGEWKIPYGSMSWLSDLGTALYGRHLTLEEFENMCLTVNIKVLNPTPSSNVTFEVDYKCGRTKQQMANKCWPQGVDIPKSKFECYCNKGGYHAYFMVAATDGETWSLLIRCRIEGGSSWLILSRTTELDPQIADVLFGLLEGYGFDISKYKHKYPYEDCP